MLLWIISSYGQILILPILSSSSGSGPIISICDSETVTFTSTGDVGVTHLNFEFNISFDFSVYRRNNRGGYKRLSIDNY
ncbi:MAG: hypothetical protein P8M60_04045 [Flavobacteriaceae bacterium]|nr:hypothetical protein [Flavobacteriaceae bacterium]